MIEEKGEVKSIGISAQGAEMTVLCSKIPGEIKPGASISINGACQTVTAYSDNSITVQASNETLQVTNFKSLKKGSYVNLERALTLNTRLDGHIVSGHVDCTARLIDIRNDGFAKKMFFELPWDKTKYVIYKGSVAVNGVSLTVASIENNIFSAELIPSTLKETNLGELKKGDIVNIETDITAKYIEKILSSNNNTGKLSYSFLEENGFV